VKVGICLGKNQENFPLQLHRFSTTENIAKRSRRGLLFWLTLICKPTGPYENCSYECVYDWALHFCSTQYSEETLPIILPPIPRQSSSQLRFCIYCIFFWNCSRFPKRHAIICVGEPRQCRSRQRRLHRLLQ